MADSNVNTIYKRIVSAVEKHQITTAFALLRTLSSAVKARWEISGRISSIEQSYGYLRQYALDGVVDPKRTELLGDTANSILQTADMMVRESEIAGSPRQYFSAIRYEQLQEDSSLEYLIGEYKKEYSEILNAEYFGRKDARTMDHRKRCEELENRIFNIVWTKFPLGVDDTGLINDLLTDATLPDSLKGLVVSAVMLGGIEYYDESRMKILARAYMTTEKSVQIRALLGLLLCMYAFKDRPVGARFTEVLGSVFESDRWESDLKMAFLELARTRDTERISRTLNDEVLPEMLKMRPDLMKKMKDIDLNADEDGIAPDINPEWEELLENSKVGKKLKEINELMTDGADVMMTTFAHLKKFRYFNDVSGWFRPFSVDNRSVKEVLDDSADDIVQLIAASPMMCDSDKYSIILSLEKIPAANRRMMLDQFKISDVNLAEIQAAELNPEFRSRKNLCNKYVQDLYRFYNLYRRKSDFKNPFERPINLSSIGLLSDFFNDSDTLLAVAEFYFKRGYYPEALELLLKAADQCEADASLLQKTGYCYQHQGDYAKALEFYQRSEMLRPDSRWTMRKMAQCYRAVSDLDKSIEYYERLSKLEPDDLKAVENLGNCYLDAGRFKDALACYYKVEFLSKNPQKMYRAIAWCSLLAGDLEKSRTYYERLLENENTAEDLLNYGHLHMALGLYRDALDLYFRSASLKGIDYVADAISSDRNHLMALGVNVEIIDIVTDTILERKYN
ncbi:MAG: tetratricopeptide repeat protein [Bacteroides sp.]|nr:tetratricopeptide repeat protein [Bacteroides sp.]